MQRHTDIPETFLCLAIGFSLMASSVEAEHLQMGEGRFHGGASQLLGFASVRRPSQRPTPTEAGLTTREGIVRAAVEPASGTPSVAYTAPLLGSFQASPPLNLRQLRANHDLGREARAYRAINPLVFGSREGAPLKLTPAPTRSLLSRPFPTNAIPHMYLPHPQLSKNDE